MQRHQHPVEHDAFDLGVQASAHWQTYHQVTFCLSAIDILPDLNSILPADLSNLAGNNQFEWGKTVLAATAVLLLVIAMQQSSTGLVLRVEACSAGPRWCA